MKKFSSEDRSILIRLASRLPSGSPERRAILSGLKKSAPDYLPKSGLEPFKKILDLIEESPDSHMKRSMLEIAKEMESSAKNFFNRGERFKPQAELILGDAGNMVSIVSMLDHPKERENSRSC